MSSNTKSSEAALAQSLIAGTGKRFANVSSITFGGATYTTQQLTTLFQSIVPLYSAVDAARATLKVKIAASEVQAAPVLKVMSAYRAYVRAYFGNSPEALLDFGLSPVAARPKATVEEKALAVGKVRATRAARHTVGKRQKAKIKGEVAEPQGSVAEPAISPTGLAAAPKTTP